MKLGDWLDVTDGGFCIIYVGKDDAPCWFGYSHDIPWDLGKMRLQDDKDILDYSKPIDFRNDLGEEYNHRPGFVISLTEKDETV